MAADKVILAGYLVRCPLGGYAWQALHYLAGLRAAGLDPYFYEDTAFYADCFDPSTGDMHVAPDAGIAFAADFFARFGFADHWMFWDAERDQYHGLGRETAAAVLQDARLLLTLAAVNRLPRRAHQTRIFIDIDPGFTQIRLDDGDAALREVVAEHDVHFTFGEHIGTPTCPVPTAGFAWRPTRQPVATQLWEAPPPEPQAAFTTIGRWDERRRDLRFRGEVYAWSKRVEWMRFLALPHRTGQAFLLAMDIDKHPEDADLLRRHGWAVTDPIAVSRDALAYREFIQRSRGEFTVAKDLNVRLSTGWFSDRAACYLAAGRPVVTQDTGFGGVLPLGRGLFAVRTLDEAVAAFATIVGNYEAHAAAARRLAADYFDAERTLRRLLAAI
jgi:hypothetical protein